MKRTFASVVMVVLLLLVITPLNGSLSACPNCYGDPESSMTSGMNMAILSLLGITGGVLGAFVAFFMYLRKRFHGLNERFADRLN